MISKLLAKISATVGYGIFCMSVLTYVNSIVREPTDRVSSVSLSAFALIAALSGLCFGMAQVLPNQEDKDQTLYSGDKFLHSSLLILQVIALKYAAGNILTFAILKPYPTVIKIVSVTVNVFLVMVSSYAAYFMLYGFETLNDFLWNRFLERRRIITNQKSRKQINEVDKPTHFLRTTKAKAKKKNG